MTKEYAHQFSEIPEALKENEPLRKRAVEITMRDPIAGKVSEGDDRLEAFRGILVRLFEGVLSLEEAAIETSTALERESSPHCSDNRVFPSGWEERLVRTQFSRFYNQAVLEELLEAGIDTCYVPHSAEENADSPCSLQLAGGSHSVAVLHSRLVDSYGKGEGWKELKIPHHPHCTHVVAPV